MKINYLFTSIVALALLAACDNNPQRINSNQNVSYNNLNNKKYDNCLYTYIFK